MKIITCFSYKGGAARTTAAVNIAAALSSIQPFGKNKEKEPIGRKVAVLDLDVFSAGTHRVFEIPNKVIKEFDRPSIQDYLQDPISAGDYVSRGGITFEDELMEPFRLKRGAEDNCHPGFTLFPAKPEPLRFVVQKQHDNLLFELMTELESRERAFDFAILDGESGTRQMADIALRLADIVLIFFRLTWQHIDGTLNFAKDFRQTSSKPLYLIPTCVPLVGEDDHVYDDNAPGLAELKDLTERIPEDSELNDFARANLADAGYFWGGSGDGNRRICIHESLLLKGEERIIVFGADGDKAADDFYYIAREIDELHGPNAD